MIKIKCILMTLFWVCALRVAGEERMLACWEFTAESLEEWASNSHHCRDVRIDDGILKGVMTGHDPFLNTPFFTLEATPWQVIEFEARTLAGGRGQIFWIPEGAQRAREELSVSFNWNGDGQWHTYRVRPYWHSSGEITRVRLDFAVPMQPDMVFEMKRICVRESVPPTTADRAWQGAALATAWSADEGAHAIAVPEGGVSVSMKDGKGIFNSPGLGVTASSAALVAIDMAVDQGDAWKISWISSTANNRQEQTFRVRADGRFHTYNVCVGANNDWAGDILRLWLGPLGGVNAKAHVRAITLTNELQGPAEIEFTMAIMRDTANRVGKPVALLFSYANVGGSHSGNLRLACESLPPGVRLVARDGWEQVPRVPALESCSHTVYVIADRVVTGTAVFKLSGDGLGGGKTVAVQLKITPDLKLPHATYVPKPRPVRTPYEIGAFYFPGWSKIEAWEKIWKVAPERRPALGWYDEANPEVVDWQIKWAVENGISFFLVDWYWHQGQQHHDHWLKAYQKARYRSHLKWAMMWANHNREGSHSEADQAAVTRFWIENYFNMPEYYQIDGKPVVMVWSALNMNRDLKRADGCRRLLELSRQMAIEAGFNGIYFIAMNRLESATNADNIAPYKEMGFDMTSIYHYMHHGGKAENPRRFSFDLVAESNANNWRGLHETGILPFLPNLSTGWDDRPWHGDRGIEIYGRTVEHFRRICRDAKHFADETGVRRLLLAPINEWGEGSYAEPNTQFGFGMYEALRDTFCEQPEGGWPLNYVPADVGLGPYDLSMPEADLSHAWSFRDGLAGWRVLMGINELGFGAAGLTFQSTTVDPALTRGLHAVYAADFSKVAVRMRVAGALAGETCQLFWKTSILPISEESSMRLPLAVDGAFHDYVFDVSANSHWGAKITQLRFDPINRQGVTMTLESIQLLPSK